MNECLQLAERLGLAAETVLELWAERAAIREYEGGQSRADAEAAAVDDVRTSLSAGLSTIAVGERKGPRSAAPAASVSDVLADTHKR
ncbi:MAG: hypothetical protein ACKV2T_37210 [Kofleriaceae bacterium]